MSEEKNHIVEYLLQLRKNSPTEYQEILRVLDVEEINKSENIRTKNLASDRITSSKKCESCGIELEPFENKICGPCRMENPKIHEESFE